MLCINLFADPLNRAERRAFWRLRFIEGPGSPGLTFPRRRLATADQVASYLGVIPRTVRNHISRGLYPAYKIPGVRGVRVDLNDVDKAMEMVPTVRRPQQSSRQPFGPKATIIPLPAGTPVPVAIVKPEAGE